MKTSRLLFLLPLAAASLLCLGRPAHAGYWQLTYQCQGSGQRTSVGSPDYPSSYSSNYPWSNDPAVYMSSYGSVSFWMDPPIRYRSSASVSEAGTITATFTWVPSYAGDVPPGTTLNVLEAAGTYADMGDTYQVSDGLGDPTVVVSYQPQSAGKHLISVPIVSSGGQFTATLSTRALSASASVSDSDPAGFPNHTYLDASVSYSATQDTRAVTISADVDVTNTKTTLLIAPDAVSVDANGDDNFIPTPNQRGQDGTMYGDTIYSYNTHQDGAYNNSPNVNWCNFTPNFSGNWHWKTGQDHLGQTVLVPNVVNPNTWGWSPSESEDNWDYGVCSMPLAANYALINGYPKGQDASTIYSVIYTATDNTDGATASARYVMTVHDPYEKSFPDHTQDMTDDANEKQLGTYGPQAPFNGSPISASVTTENPWSVKVKASGEIPLPWIGGALGVDVEKSVTDDDKIGVSCSDNHTRAGDYSYVEAVDHYIYHHGKVDTWGVYGYKGTQPYEVWEVGTPAHLLRLHTPYGNATPGPSPPH